ncbi:Mannose-1-phosphate guanyltransferase [Candidatus Magnetobacterium bavaricum]|uniref:Mannose-1-phosphate guanyltransferase n=1 Tax=Candidatus Magnetobacterium bavaricum TaxID=29290 RepID=A0A0F3H273_9BACT|nr:Mannose-1-phosphate guanyltransferase [Candidatus Magnetobacterium bavaricum]
MTKTAIVLAGGFGTRLKGILGDLPKPMADINGRPFLQYLLEHLRRQGIDNCLLSVGYRREAIMDFFGQHFGGIDLTYCIEDEPLGTGGAIKKALSFVDTQEVFALNGDTLFFADLPRLYDLYRSHDCTFAMALKPMRDFDRYGVVVVDDTHRVVGFQEKRARDFGLINGGVYVINTGVFDKLDLPTTGFSFEKDFLELYYKTKRFCGFEFDAYFIDIGIVQDYERAKAELA